MMKHLNCFVLITGPLNSTEYLPANNRHERYSTPNREPVCIDRLRYKKPDYIIRTILFRLNIVGCGIFTFFVRNSHAPAVTIWHKRLHLVEHHD